MADGKHCPACERDIGVWAVFRAGLPNRIRCPHCSARLGLSRDRRCGRRPFGRDGRCAGGGWYAAAAIPDLPASRRRVAAVGIMLGIWVLIELAVVQFLRRNRVHVRPGFTVPSPGEPDAD